MAPSASSSSSSTPLLYACIAYHTTILTEHTSSPSSKASSLASVVLPKIKHDKLNRMTYTHDQTFVHYIANAEADSAEDDDSFPGGLTYLVIAPSDLGRLAPFGFLSEVKDRFRAAYPTASTDFAHLPAYGAANFNSTLKGLMVEQGSREGGQYAFGNAQQEIDSVRGIMTENIERVLERGERIDLLVDKTDRLGGNARDFRVRGRNLRRQMWWKNVKLMALLIVVIIFLIYLFVGFGCGLPTWNKCIGK